MKKFFVLATVAIFTLTACTKDKPDGPRTDVPAELQSLWMHGYFSATEYWSQDPSEYLGNGLELAMAFQFNANGTYTQYFTARSYMAGGSTYHQSVTTGTVEIDPVAKTIITHPHKSHYKRTRNKQVEEDRDMRKDELDADNYTYTTGVEAGGTKALYLKIAGSSSAPLAFLQMP